MSLLNNTNSFAPVTQNNVERDAKRLYILLQQQLEKIGKAFKCMSESAIGCLTKHKFSCFFISYSYILELSVWLNTA